MDQIRIGKKIKEIRIKEGLTQKEFADLFGVTYQAVSKWERGLNIPDIGTLTQICTKFSYDVHELLTGQKQRKDKKILYMGVTLFLIVLLFLLFLLKKDNFTFKTLSSNCENFNITGSIAYNKEKTSIYISNISYCGEKETKKYQSIECNLYEINKDTKIRIENYSFKEENSVLLEEFLKKITFKVDDYIASCKNYKENTLFLEIDAMEENGEISFFKIPLKLENNCA